MVDLLTADGKEEHHGNETNHTVFVVWKRLKMKEKVL